MKTETKNGVFVASVDDDKHIVEFKDETQVKATISKQLLSQASPGFPLVLVTGNEVAVEMPKPNPNRKGEIIRVIK